MRTWVAEILGQIRVLMYSGQLDLLVPYTETVNFLRHLNFSDAEAYRLAPRHIWTVNNDIAGYVKEGGNLVEVMVRNAGHLVPSDQPLWALDMITKFTRNKKIY